MGGKASYCTFGPRARTVIYEFSDFGVLCQYTAVQVQMCEEIHILGCICGAQSMGGNPELRDFWASRAYCNL